MDGILKQKDFLELKEKLLQVITFGATMIQQVYGQYLSDEQKQKLTEFQNGNQVLFTYGGSTTSESECLVVDVSEAIVSYLEELQRLELYENAYLINHYNQNTTMEHMKLSSIHPLVMKDHAVHYLTTRTTFSEYMQSSVIRMLFRSIIQLEIKIDSDIFYSSFEKRLKEGIIELYSRRLCENEIYQKQFQKQYGYILSNFCSMLSESILPNARFLDEQLGEDKTMVFQNSWEEILFQYPTLKQKMGLEGLKAMKQTIFVKQQNQKGLPQTPIL